MTDQVNALSIHNDRLRRLATYASVGVSTVLIIAKLTAYFFTDSVALLSSLLDSTIDLIAALVTVFGVASALRPPDHDHRFGHGKAEPLAALAQSAFITGSSVLLIYEAASRFYHPHEIENQNFGYFVMALAIALSLALVWFQNHVVKRTSSMAIGADKLHYIGDLAINAAVVVSFALYAWTGIDWLDPFFALLIAGGLTISAFHIAMRALHVLMDRELPDEDREKIKAIVSAHTNVRGLHDLRTRSDGERVFIEFHLELDGNMTLKAAHHIDEAITDDLQKSFPNADILIHQDPAGIDEPRLDEQIEVSLPQMNDVLFVLLGAAHLLALVALILVYVRKIGLPWREWPLFLFLVLWSALVLAGYLVSPFDGLNNLPIYTMTSFVALGLMLWAHYAFLAAPQKTPYTRLNYPDFVAITQPKLRNFLWWLLAGTLAVALLVHLIVCFSFYPVNADSLNYRLARIIWYISHGNVLHPFDSIDKRLTFYPVDGLLLYVPIALYGVSAVFFSLPSLFSWMAVAYVSYRFARNLQAERLIALFAMWLVAMTPSILIEASSTNDEILTAAPLLVGLFFAWRWLTTGTEHYLLLAAIGAGLCIGTKLHIFFLIPIIAMAALWFAWFLWRRHESWRQWLPYVRLSTLLASLAALGFFGLTFLILNFISSGQFYFLNDTAHQVLNLGASLQDALQNFMIYTASMVLAPIADLNFWQTFHQREVTNVELNNIFAPLINPFVNPDPHLFHLKYRYQGVIIPTSVLLVEYGLWPGLVWLLWPLQGVALRRKSFTLRPFFLTLAATPIIWLVIWSCVTLYMEGVPTYFAFYLMCAAPAMALCFVGARSKLGNRVRWAIIALVVLTNIVIDGNVAVNNTFRGLWHFTEDKPWPYDWLLFEKPIIDEIKRADQIHIAITHGKVYYFAFMHWHPTATYYSPYAPPPDSPKVLHILSTPSEFSYGFMPIKIPGKLTPGITYLGRIRGVDREEVFAFGNGVERRYPDASDFISMHMSVVQQGHRYLAYVDPIVAGLNNPADRLEFNYEIKDAKGHVVYARDWKSNPVFSAELPEDPTKYMYALIIKVRSGFDEGKTVTQAFALGGGGAWRINRPGDTAETDDDY